MSEKWESPAAVQRRAIERTAQQQKDRVRLTNSLHIFADEVESMIADAAETMNLPPEDVLDWLTNELINRRSVCRHRP